MSNELEQITIYILKKNNQTPVRVIEIKNIHAKLQINKIKHQNDMCVFMLLSHKCTYVLHMSCFHMKIENSRKTETKLLLLLAQ